MPTSQYVYVTYIRTTAQKLWAALLDPDTQRKFWLGSHIDTDWKKDAAWRLLYPDGRVTDAGTVVEIIPEQKLVLTWQHELRPDLKAEGPPRRTLEIETAGNAVKLTVLHEIDAPDSKLIKAVSGGWPKILSNIKSLLETGQIIPEIDNWPCETKTILSNTAPSQTS